MRGKRLLTPGLVAGLSVAALGAVVVAVLYLLALGAADGTTHYPQADPGEILSGAGERLVVYAAEWCPHCRRNAPEIARFKEGNPGVEVVVVFTARGSSPEAIRREVEERWGFADRVYVDWDGRFAEALGVTATPTFIAYRSGAIAVSVGVATAEELKLLMEAASGGG
jgi:thiol-disulfide isomerase/thioredoxin